MNDGHTDTVICPVCQQARPSWDVIPGSTIPQSLVDIVRQLHPEWSEEQIICSSCLAEARDAFITQVKETEQARARASAEETVESIKGFEQQSSLIGKSLVEEISRRRTPGERISDSVTAWVGSWSFLVANVIFLVIWIVINSLAIFTFHFDPYPFIFLNLVVSWISVLEAPLIMMSQNRQDTRDRMRDEHDYGVNRAAETEIRSLNKKLDQLLLEHWPQMVEIQRLQLELMEQAARHAPPPPPDTE